MIIDKTLIINEIKNLISLIKEEREIDKVLCSVGIEISWEGDRCLGGARDSYSNLIWKIIQEHRGIPELCDEEYEFFYELPFDVAYETRKDWTAETIYEYFINIDQIMSDFNIGE